MELVKAQIKDFAYAGQGRGVTENGDPVLVWKALPGEVVTAKVFGKRSGMLEAVAEEILESSPDRITPIEEQWFVTSPWQILDYQKELEHKRQIISEIYQDKAGIAIENLKITDTREEFHYRNSMDFTVTLADADLHLALFSRGRKRKIPVEGSQLAYKAVNVAAQSILQTARDKKLSASDMERISVRASRSGEYIAAMYNADDKQTLYEGSHYITEHILGIPLRTGIDNFFQINPDCFEKAVARIKEYITGDDIVDYYGGVGTIALAAAEVIQSAIVVEADALCTEFAIDNVQINQIANIEVITARSEQMTDFIQPGKTIILNPPREGLQSSIIDVLLKRLPQKIVYLSCKPITQARDVAPLLKKYSLEHIELFNFFPRTPHVECLVILERI